MTHEFGHIECGGAGKELGLKQITIHDHTVLNIAIHLKHENLIDIYGATKEEAITFGEEIQRDIEKWAKRLKKKWGVPYHDHDVNPDNLK